MPRASSKKLREQDKDMFKALACVGHLSKEQIIKEFGIKEYRINQFINQNKLQETVYKKTGAKYYKLHEDLRKSKQELRKYCGTERPYHAQSIRHDSPMAAHYLNLDKKIRDTWTTESKLKSDFMNMLKKMDKSSTSIEIDGDQYFANDLKDMWDNEFISTPDGGYITEEGVFECFEIVTDNYDQKQIDSKFTYCQIFNYDINCTRV